MKKKTPILPPAAPKPAAAKPAGPVSLDVDSIRALAEVVDRHGLSELKLRLDGGGYLILRRGAAAAAAAPHTQAQPASHHAPAHQATAHHAPAHHPPASHHAPAPVSAGGGHATAAVASAPPAVVPSTQPPAGPAPATGPNGQYSTVNSPFVGTFYRSPSPEAPFYVEVGQRVKKGQVVCIVEAMKLMNEIECEVDGVVVACLVENATPVEYGQALFKINP